VFVDRPPTPVRGNTRTLVTTTRQLVDVTAAIMHEKWQDGQVFNVTTDGRFLTPFPAIL